MNLQIAIPYLLENEYIVEHKGKLKFTLKFYSEFKNLETGIVKLPNNQLAVQSLPPANVVEEWRNRYMKFIVDANVPSMARGTNGSYKCNQYSEDGMKAFRKAIESGINYQGLVGATALYYAMTDMKFTIGRYMTEGTWRTEYMKVMASAKEGTLSTHVNQSTKPDVGSTRIG